MKKGTQKLMAIISIITIIISNGFVSAKAEDNANYDGNIWSKYKIAAKANGLKKDTLIEENNDINYKDDFYSALNSEWAKNAKESLSSELQEISYYTYLDIKGQADVNSIFKDILKNKDMYSSETVQGKMINLYENYIDMESRNDDGLDLAFKYVNKIEDAKSVDELTEIISTREMDIFNNLYCIGVSASDDGKENIVKIEPTILGLYFKENYFSNSKEIVEERENYKKYLMNVLKTAGYDSKDAKNKAKDLIYFEELISKDMISLNDLYSDNSNFDSSNLLVNYDELRKIAPNLKLDEVLDNLGLYDSEKLVKVYQKNWLKGLNKIYTDKNLELIKNYLEITILQALGSFTNEEMSKLIDERYSYINLDEESEPTTIEEDAYSVVYSNFEEAIGKLYSDKYCNEQEKMDIEMLGKELIKNYRIKLMNCDWISEGTRNAALDKLDNMKINIGYPEKYEDYEGVVVRRHKDGGSLVENMVNIELYNKDKEFSKLYEPVSRELFDNTVTPQSASALYSFPTNSLVISAGILEPDFYDINDSKEKKLATIGFILGHEISHAFDEIGALYDSEGNYKNWWSDEDYKEFNKKAEKYKEYYSGLEYFPDTYVNGENTLGENIADVTSMSCLLDIMDDIPDANYKEFFESFAIGCRCVRSEENERLMLQWDVHSPFKWRVNAVLSQYEEFYETYDIKEGDKMYVKPEDRLRIW